MLMIYLSGVIVFLVFVLVSAKLCGVLETPISSDNLLILVISSALSVFSWISVVCFLLAVIQTYLENR